MIGDNMTSNPLISIVMAAYNAEPFIEESIQSAIEQTYQNWELIVVDDCSTDSTKEIVKSYRDSRVKLVPAKVNGGPGVSRNIGIEHSQGEFIAFLDSDDIWVPQKLEKQVSFMLRNNLPISHTTYSFINENGKTIAGFVKASPKVNLKHYMRNTEIGMSSSMINKNMVKNIFFSPMRDREDTKLWIGLLEQNFVSYGLDEILMKYRVREGQVSGNKFKSAYRTLKLYLSITSISLPSRTINFCYYLLNGILKRFRS